MYCYDLRSFFLARIAVAMKLATANDPARVFVLNAVAKKDVREGARIILHPEAVVSCFVPNLFKHSFPWASEEVTFEQKVRLIFYLPGDTNAAYPFCNFFLAPSPCFQPQRVRATSKPKRGPKSLVRRILVFGVRFFRRPDSLDHVGNLPDFTGTISDVHPERFSSIQVISVKIESIPDELQRILAKKS